jgi:hypothetical protein
MGALIEVSILDLEYYGQGDTLARSFANAATSCILN